MTALAFNSATERWTASRKAALLSSIHASTISAAEAMERYAITPEEMASWEERERRFGQAALRITTLQEFRP